MDKDIVMILAVFTIGAVLIIGAVVLARTRRARDRHEDAAVAERGRRQAAAGKEDVRPTTPSEDVESESGRAWSKQRGANPPTPNLPPD
ncbi:MAG: hypothetical protein GC147_02695 [Porphyrobacter sp.]|nr:hypothetical protein [Porphyrobacter sp.]